MAIRKSSAKKVDSVITAASVSDEGAAIQSAASSIEKQHFFAEVVENAPAETEKSSIGLMQLVKGLKKGLTPPAKKPTTQSDQLMGKASTAPDLSSSPIQEKEHLRTADPVTRNRPVDHEKTGWVSPSYLHSRSVKLNPQVLMENRCVGYQPEAPELEFYRVLRTHILQQTGGRGNTIMVTSACPGEGKTLTAINLAFTFAREFKQTALLVDCDLKSQKIHDRLGFPSDKGLVDYLMDDAPISDLMVWPGVEKLTIISGGKTVQDSSELLGSLGMKNLVTDMKTRYPDRYVFFDVPPLLTCADSLAFAPLVDYILVVVQAGQTSLQDVNKALKLLPGEKVLGLVMNRQQHLI